MNVVGAQDDRELERGPLPNESMCVRVAYPSDLFETVTLIAARQDVSVQALIRRAVRELLSEEAS